MTTLAHSIAHSPSFSAGDATSTRRSLRAKKLSVVVPCYNELERLPELVRRLNYTCTDGSPMWCRRRAGVWPAPSTQGRTVVQESICGFLLPTAAALGRCANT